jgi:uncharacterized membrane protein
LRFWSNTAAVKHNCFQVASVKRDAYQTGLNRNLYWIWFVGAAAWFLDAALSLHHRELGGGLLATAISALFLAAGMFFRRQAKRSDKL